MRAPWNDAPAAIRSGSAAAMQHAAGVPERAMADFLDGVEARWGSVIGYLTSIGIDTPTLDAVRENFLSEPETR